MNKTQMFMYPLLELNIHKEPTSVYLGKDIHNTNIEEPKLYILFNPKDIYEFADILNTIEDNPLYHSSTDLEEDKKLVVMMIPEKFRPDYYKFILGKYSEMSQEAKQLIVDNASDQNMSKLKMSLKDYYKGILDMDAEEIRRRIKNSLYEDLSVKEHPELREAIDESKEVLSIIKENEEILPNMPSKLEFNEDISL